MVMIMFGMFQTGWLYLMNYLIWFNAHINPTNYQMVLLFPLLEENGCLTMSSVITSQTTGKQKNLDLDGVVLIPSVQVQCPYSMLYCLQHACSFVFLETKECFFLQTFYLSICFQQMAIKTDSVKILSPYLQKSRSEVFQSVLLRGFAFKFWESQSSSI